MKAIPAVVAMTLLVLARAETAFARGEESFGNKPLAAANYADWQGVLPVINSPQRIYTTWVNGNEHFYFQGDVDQLNEVLRDFAKVETPVRELVIRPENGITKTFDGKVVPYDWNVHLIGGIARHMSRLDKGALVWPTHPVMTLYLGMDFPLEKLQIPEEVTVTRVAELKKRIIEALESRDQTVRGWSAGELADVDRFDGRSVTIIARMLDDDEGWVRLNAAGALARFGAKSRSILDQLRPLEKSDDEALRTQVAKSIAEIEKAEDAKDAEKDHQARLKAIDRFLSSRSAKR